MREHGVSPSLGKILPHCSQLNLHRFFTPQAVAVTNYQDICKPGYFPLFLKVRSRGLVSFQSPQQLMENLQRLGIVRIYLITHPFVATFHELFKPEAVSWTSCGECLTSLLCHHRYPGAKLSGSVVHIREGTPELSHGRILDSLLIPPSIERTNQHTHGHAHPRCVFNRERAHRGRDILNFERALGD